MAAIKKNEVRTATLEESEAEAPAENPEIDVSEDEEGVEAKTEDDDEDEEDEKPTRSRRAKKANRLKEYQTQADERVRNAEERARQAELVAAHAAGLREAEAQRLAFERLTTYEQDSVIEFLKSLQVLPPGTNDLIVDEHYRRRDWPPLPPANQSGALALTSR